MKFFTKETLDAGVKKIARQGFTKEALEDFTRVGLKDMTAKQFAKRKIGQAATGFGKGALTEGYTETLQSIVEQVGEQIFDNIKDPGTKGYYGTDFRSKEFWLQAAEEGFYGAILGGVMAGGGASSHGLKEQSTYHYVRSSLAKGKPQNITALKNYAAKQEASGNLSKQEYKNFITTVDQMVDAESRMWHKLDSPAAKYQSYNNMMIKDATVKVEESPWLAGLEKDYPNKKIEVDGLIKEIKSDVESIIEAISDEDSNFKDLDTAEKAELVLSGKAYKYNPVLESEIAPELTGNIKKLNKIVPSNLKISSLYNKQAENEGKIQAVKDGIPLVKEEDLTEAPYGRTYKTEGGQLITDAALNNKAEFNKMYNEAMISSPKAKEKIVQDIQEQFGIDKEAANYLYNNQNVTADELEEVQPKQESEEEQVVDETPLYKLQEEIKEDYGVDVEFGEEKTFKKPTTDIKGFGGVQAVRDVIEVLESKGYSQEGTADTDASTQEEKTDEDKGIKSTLAPKTKESTSSPQAEKTTTEATESTKEGVTKKTPPVIEVKETVPESTESVTESTESDIIEGVTDIKPLGEEDITQESIIKRLESEDLSPEEREALIKKQAEINAAVELMNMFSGADLLKEQRVIASPYEASLVSNNPELYSKIKKHFKNIFPNIPIKEVNILSDKYGGQVLARVVETGIEIDPTKAIQSSVIHEYAHVYLDILGNKNPLVKIGYKIIEGTKFDKEAQRLYPEKSRSEQLNEALTEALAQDSLNKLSVKFEGSTFDKFKEYAKKFWGKIKSFFTKPKSRDIVGILSDGLILRNKPYSVGLSFLVGMNKNQIKTNIHPRFLKTVDILNTSLIFHRLASKEKGDSNFNHTNVGDVTKIAFNALYKRYNQERLGQIPDNDVQIFEGRDLDVNLIENVTPATYLPTLKDFANKVRTQFPQVYERVKRVVETMHKINLDIDTIEDVEDDVNQDIDAQTDSSKNAIKASKKINSSVRSILSTILDEDGYQVNTDSIYQYVSYLAQNTYKKSGFMEKLEKDAKVDLIPSRILSIVNMLSDDQRAGFLKTISSLIQVKSEGTNIEKKINEDGTASYKLTNPIKNKDKTSGGVLGQVQNNFNSWKDSDKMKRFAEVFNFKDKQLIIDKDITKMSDVSNILNQLFGIGINIENIGEIIDSFNTKRSDGFYNAMAGKFESFLSYFQEKEVNRKPVTLDRISGFIDKIINTIEDKSRLQNTFLNGAGNTVSTTQTGHWISELNSMLINRESGRMNKMLNSPIYKNNSVLKYFNNQKQINYSKPDSIKNLNTNENVEYSQQSKDDYHVMQLHKFATNTSNKYYNQTLGVMSNRDSMMLFEVPTYSNSQLNSEYKIQAKGLEKQLADILKNKNEEERAKIINDFNNLYIHKADANGNITPGIDVDYDSQIKEIKDILVANDLIEAYSQVKVGKGKPFASIDDMLENYFYTEALNRIYLNDIYGGTAILHTNSKKGAVESSVKRMSGPNSNGELNEIDKPVTLIVYKNGGSDSFNINGSHLSEQISKDAGSLDPVGINSKDQVYQIDPIDGSSLYIKNSSLNLKGNEFGTNLDGFGQGYQSMANAIIAIEKYLATEEDANPYVKFLDEDSLKGTFSKYEAVDIRTILDAVQENNIDKIADKFAKVEIDNHRTLFNLNKKLEAPSKQTAIMSTQAGLIQFNSATQEAIDSFEKAAIRYLNTSMNGEYEESKVFEDLMNYDKTIDELTRDLNDREKSSTTDILEAVKKYNQTNPENKIESFDHPSLRLIYEQFVSSRLSKKGVKIEMSGNFLHQLPDMDSKINPLVKLERDEVAVPYKMFANSMEEANALLNKGKLDVVVVRIPASAEMSIFAGKVKYFLDTDSNVVALSDKFVEVSDSDHDGDKAMVYRKEINEDGSISEYSSKSQLFKEFHKNVSSKQFVDNSLNSTLDLDPVKEAVKEIDKQSGKKTQTDYATSTINDVVDVATKMGLGQEATGRFAIASKLMSLLSQSRESLNKPIKYKEKVLKDFTNKSLDSVAVFLQAALDIGNDPVLTTTGFNSSTIDVGNAMLLLGLSDKEVISFLKSKEITKLGDDFEKANLSFSDKNKISFNQFLKKYSKSKSGEDIPFGEIKSQYGENVADFIEFKKVADGLAKIIGYIQLDKSLPNNSELNAQLLDSLKEFNDLPFSTEKLKNRMLYVHREKILKLQRNIYRKQLITSNPELRKITDSIAETTYNPYEFKRRITEQLMQYFAQNQISKERESVSNFIYGFSKKMNTLYNAAILGKTDIEVASHIEAIHNTIIPQAQEALYNDYLKYTTKEKLDKELREYDDALAMVNLANKFKGNTFFENLIFNPKSKGSSEVVMSLSPEFKATDQSKKEFQKDFKKIQETNPELARDIIDYQLYRYGVNNKIGSFIDGLPMDINIKMLRNITKFKNNPNYINDYKGEIANNLILANQDLFNQVKHADIKKVIDDKTITLNKDKGVFVSYEDNIYRKTGDVYKKFNKGKFEADNNFVAYNTGRLDKTVATKEEIINLKKSCNG